MTANEAREMAKKFHEEKVKRNHEEAQKVRKGMDTKIAEAANNGSNYTSLAVPGNHTIWTIVKKMLQDDGFEVSRCGNDEKIFYVKW